MDGGATLGRGHVFPVQNYKKGARIWHRHPQLVWIGGVLEEDISFQTRRVRIRLEDDTTDEYDITSLEQLPFLRNPAFLVGKDDLTLLSYLHEPAVLHNLQVRFVNSNSIYTYCGIVLVAINPYADCSHIYREEIIQVYQGAGKSAREMDPHIFAVAEEAHFDMGAFGKSQSIIVSGESGAGKTVSAKFVMRYLASVAASKTKREGTTTIEARVLASNPIMESIGNAKTIRNDNSSRFGKFIQINFCERGKRIVGAEMKTYLLEKSRLVFQAPGERNYHIFYQLCAARNHSVLKDLHLGPCESYSYLTQGGDSRIPGVDDKADFDELLKALQLLGFDEKQISDVFRLLAGLLLLGNVHFENGESSSAVSSGSDSEIARLCSEMWQISESDLRVWLTRREIRAVNEVVTKPMTKNEAVRSRDALTKMLYAHLFGWLVDKINEALNEKESNEGTNRRKRPDRFIGVLDIYGFETFDINSFEQFSINYANEKLQQQFNQHVFKLEQEEYIREEIEWVRVDFHDNQPAIDLIEGPVGMINLLDEQCKRLNGSDADWLSQLRNSTELKKNPQLAFPRVRSNDFIVRHFAADVTYSTDGFVEKNRDAIGEQLLDVVVASKLQFLRTVIGPAVVATPAGSTPGKRTTKRTVASQFRESLKDLMQVLCSTRPHYVRCIKPNDSKISFDFEPKRAIQQLRACGVLETVRISAAGFPSRYPYDEFARRYRVLYNKQAALWRDKPKQFAELACQQCLEEGKYAVGKTKIFLRTGQVAVLERVRLDTLAAAATIIQKTWKGFVARRKYETMRKSLLIVQASLRAFLAFRRIKYLQMHRAVITMQSAVRGFLERRKYEKIRKAVIGIQAAFKAQRVRRHVEKLRYEKSAITIQSAWRGYSVRREQIAKRKKVVMVQCAVRKWLAKRRLRELKIEARSVGHLQKLNTGLENKIIELQIRLDIANARTKEETEKLTVTNKDLEKTKAELAMMEAERLTLLEARHRVEVLQEEVERLETECDLKEAQRGGMETKVVDLQSRLDQMQSESGQKIAELTERLEKTNAAQVSWETERQKMEAELSSERAARHALDAEVTAMREQLMKNVDLFESSSFQKKPSPKKIREEESCSRTTSNLSQLTGSFTVENLNGSPPAASSRGSPEALLDNMALTFEQLRMINDLRQRNEHCQRETERMKAILEASTLIDTLDKKTSLKAFESIRVTELEGAYNRLKNDMERVVSGQNGATHSVFERIMEENERLRDEAVELRSMLSSHFERQSVAGSSGYRRSPRPDSGHCSGADSEDGSSGADLEEDLCIERQCRHLKNLAENLTRMLTNQNLEIERLQQQLRFSESQSSFRPSDCSLDEAVRGAHKQTQLLAQQNMDLNDKLTRQSEELAEARAQLRGYSGPLGLENTSDEEIIRLEAFEKGSVPHSGFLEVYNVPEFARIIICELKPSLARLLTKNLPAYLLLAAFRSHDEKRDETALTGLFSSVHLVLKDTISRSHDLDLLSLWLVNLWRLFNLLRQYSGEDKQPEWHVANTETQNSYRFKAYDVAPIRDQLKLRIEECYSSLMKKAIEHVFCPKIVPGILQHESSSDLMTAGQDRRDRNSGNVESQRKSLDDLLQFMDIVHTKLKTYGGDDVVVKQVIGQMANWMCCLALNHMMFRRELCNFEKAIQIKHNVTEIQNWLNAKGLPECRDHLEPLVQACHLLQSRKDASNLDTLCGEMTSRLKPRQVVAILQHYDPSDEMEDGLSPEFLVQIQKKLNERAIANGNPIEDKDALIMIGTYLPPFNTQPFSYSDFPLETLSLPSCLHMQSVCRLV
ncbi:unnamed protein product [Caenorhabditis brenneri]